MPKYLVHGLYSAEGFKGLLKETASARKASISKTYESLGGRVEAFYLTEENAGLVMIADLPDSVSTAALTLVVQASGAFASLHATQLYGVEELDQAIKKTVAWRPPGK
jgi:uncharacterized protein with GYD domain